MENTKNRFGKTLIAAIAVLLVGLCVLPSCKKDGNAGGNGDGYIILDGKRYDMKTATYADIDVAGQQAVTLTIDNDLAARRHFNIQFQERTFAALASGTYTLKTYPWPNADGTYKPGEHFAASDFVYDCTGMAIETCQDATLTSGTVTIRKTGGTISIDLEGRTSKGTVEAHYEGPIKNLVNIDF